MRGWHAHDSHVHSDLYRAILEQILSGDLAPGQRLVEEELARTHSVSRTPVREVLFALQKDGLVERQKNKGARVAAFTADDVEELFDIRKALELSCVPHAVRSIKLEELLHLEQRLQNLSAVRRPHIREAQSEIDLDLHGLIVNNSGNRRLIGMIEALSTLVNALQVASYRLGQRAEEAVEEHHAIIRAMLQRDVDLTQKLLSAHIDNGKRNAVELLLGLEHRGRASRRTRTTHRKS